jgi:hypothetical protein
MPNVPHPPLEPGDIDGYYALVQSLQGAVIERVSFGSQEDEPAEWSDEVLRRTAPVTLTVTTPHGVTHFITPATDSISPSLAGSTSTTPFRLPLTGP